LLHYPRQPLIRHQSTATSITTKESISIPNQIIHHLDAKPPLNDSQCLDRVLNNLYTKKEIKSFYRRLSNASPEAIVKLFVSQLDTIEYNKQLRHVFLDAGAYWSVDTIQGVIKALGIAHSKMQLDLLTQLLLPKYMLDRDITALIHALPEKGHLYTLMPFYNAVLSKCQRYKELDHVRLVLTIMKERNIAFDIATFNILIKMKLSNGLEKDDSSTLYQTLLDEGIRPNLATFNTFIKHAINLKDWDALDPWLDAMKEHDITPTAITIRILFRALVRYPSESQLTRAFDRVTASLPISHGEKLWNTGAMGLLEVNDTRFALNLITKAIECKEPVSVYCYNIYLKSLCMEGSLEKAQSVLESMISSDSSSYIPKPDIVSFTTVIHGLVRNNESEQALALYDQVINERGLHANNVLHTVMLNNLMKSPQNNMDKVQALFASIVSNKNIPQLPQQHADMALNEINIYNMMMDFYFLHYHKSKQLRNQIPPQPFALLKDIVNKKQLKPTVATLNIMVKGLAILNKDLNAAEKMVALMKSKGVEMDEKTVWYLTKSAYKQGQLNRARQWIEEYESQNKSIKGSGLLQLKSILTKWDTGKEDAVE
jgi:pentatricopeptide repeat protein